MDGQAKDEDLQRAQGLDTRIAAGFLEGRRKQPALAREERDLPQRLQE